jgi:tRNA G18 (ribose-2'-O)-methylase SpoU
MSSLLIDSAPLARFVQLRHKPVTPLERPRELVLACAELRSSANLGQIVRMAGNSAVRRVIVAGKPNVDRNVSREAVEQVMIEPRRSLPPVLERLRRDGYQIVALEQTTGAESLHRFPFVRRTALVIGNERAGVSEEVLALADRVAEIPVYGLPHSYNAATTAMLALYEYCRQFPSG